MTTRQFGLILTAASLGALAATAACTAVPAQESQTAYTPVTDERLRSPDPARLADVPRHLR